MSRGVSGWDLIGNTKRICSSGPSYSLGKQRYFWISCPVLQIFHRFLSFPFLVTCPLFFLCNHFISFISQPIHPSIHPSIHLKLTKRQTIRATNRVKLSGELTWPLGLQRMLVHSGPVPHLCCSFHRKSDGGLCLARLAAAHTYEDRKLSC